MSSSVCACSGQQKQARPRYKSVVLAAPVCSCSAGNVSAFVEQKGAAIAPGRGMGELTENLNEYARVNDAAD